MCHRCLASAFGTVFLVGIGLSAPVTKEKLEPAGPITEKQVETSTNNLKQLVLAWNSDHNNNSMHELCLR